MQHSVDKEQNAWVEYCNQQLNSMVWWRARENLFVSRSEYYLYPPPSVLPQVRWQVVFITGEVQARLLLQHPRIPPPASTGMCMFGGQVHSNPAPEKIEIQMA